MNSLFQAFRSWGQHQKEEENRKNSEGGGRGWGRGWERGFPPLSLFLSSSLSFSRFLTSSYTPLFECPEQAKASGKPWRHTLIQTPLSVFSRLWAATIKVTFGVTLAKTKGISCSCHSKSLVPSLHISVTVLLLFQNFPQLLEGRY